MTGDRSHVTNQLAQFVAGSQWEAIPPEVRCEGVRGLLNFVGCALGGAHDAAMCTAVVPFQRRTPRLCCRILRSAPFSRCCTVPSRIPVRPPTMLIRLVHAPEIAAADLGNLRRRSRTRARNFRAIFTSFTARANRR
jgi:hypothetical protein